MDGEGMRIVGWLSGRAQPTLIASWATPWGAMDAVAAAAAVAASAAAVAAVDAAAATATRSY